LIIGTNVQKIIELKPYAYYIENGEEIEIKCDFDLDENNILQYKLGKYDQSKEIIIDPVVVFSTYSGSTADNWGYTATYDNEGFLYAGGIAFNTGGSYPTTLGAYSQSFAGGQCDIVITKYDTTGSFMVYSTYLGGSEAEVPASLVVNSNNELFILSVTSSTDFPTSSSAISTVFNGGNAIMPSFQVGFPNGSDLAISRLSSNGNNLLASTYFGGSGNDGMNNSTSLRKNYADEIRGEIIIDKNDNCIVASSTHSMNIPTTSNAFQSSNSGSQDGVVFKMDNNLSNLIWASYIGGSGDDAVYSLSLDNNHDIYITGGTTSNNFPTTSNVLFSSNQGGASDGFVSKISNNGNSILHSTYFGTPSYDQSYFVDSDRYDNVYIFGQTNNSNSILIQNALWNNPMGGQFITKLTKDLSTVIWSTKWGSSTSGYDVSPSAFMVDLCNRVYLTAWGGNTNDAGSTNGLPITGNAAQTTTDGSDYYLLVMKDDASALDYATFYGGSSSAEHVDGGTSRFDKKGHVYQAVCAGCGGYSDFPTTTSCNSSTNNSINCNNAVFKFDFDVPVVIADFQQPGVLCAPATVNFSNSSYIGTNSSANFFWDFDDGNSSNVKNPSHTFSNPGIYNVKLIISDATSCNLSDTITKKVVILGDRTDTLSTKTICHGDYTQIGITPLNDPNVTYIWSPAFNLSSTNISNPIANPPSSRYYKLLVSNGICTDTLIQKVEVFNIIADAGNDTTMCDTLINLKASSNHKNLNFIWSSNNSFTDTLNINLQDSNLVVSVLNPTYFYLKVFYDKTCYSIDSVLVDKRIKLSENYNNPLCFGDSNGAISINASGGNSPYTYIWNNGSSGSSLNNLGGGTFKVLVKDQDNCIAETSITLIEPPLLESNPSVLNIPCEDACIGEAFVNVVGGTPPYSYSWNDPNNQQTNPATQLCDGEFIVTITDSNNCITLDTVEIIDSSLYMNFSAWIVGGKDSIYEGQSLQLMSNNYGSQYSYLWDPSQGLSNPNIYNPIAEPKTSTTYYVTLRDQYGCEWNDSVFIYVSDVIYDKLYVRSSVIYEISFRIYNRWGELVFETNDINNGWDGYYKGKLSEPGVFVYHLDVICYNKEIFKKKGNITLMR